MCAKSGRDEEGKCQPKNMKRGKCFGVFMNDFSQVEILTRHSTHFQILVRLFVSFQCFSFVFLFTFASAVKQKEHLLQPSLKSEQ